MKLQKIIFVFACAGIVMTSCTKNFEKINTDKNSIQILSPSEIPFLFTKALESVPINGQEDQNLFADQYAQYFANEASYFPSDRYVMDMSWLLSPWTYQYNEVVPQLSAILDATDENSPEHALAEIWWVYSFSRITDYWGPIPYSHAGEGGTSVPYDSQESIYNDFFTRLEAAVNVLKSNAGGSAFGSFDVMFGGNIDKWIKFANTLRLRLAIRISNKNPSKAQQEGEKAILGGLMVDNNDSARIIKDAALEVNKLSQMSRWGQEFGMSASMTSVLVGYNDPRIHEYFMPAPNTGDFRGLRNGLTADQIADPLNQPENISRIGPRWSTPDQGGNPDFQSLPAIVMSAPEAYFLKAEAKWLGWNVSESVKDLYEEGIRQSLIQWGVTDPNIINSYINSTSTPVPPNDYLNSPAMSGVPVKFDDNDPSMQLEQIATQKWIALYPDGWEAWADFRRRPKVNLYGVANSDNPDLPNPSRTNYIRRVPFIEDEYQTNRQAVEDAVNLLNGPDKITTALWWDVN